MKIYKVGEFAKLIGVSKKTLQRWDNSGILVAKRTLTNHRFYDEKDLEKALNS